MGVLGVAALLVAAASPARAAGVSISPADQQLIVSLHNQYRAAAGVGPLVWDEQLAADAQKWVDDLVARGGELAHDNPADPNDPDTGSAKGEGENLAGGQSPATAPGQWYEEKSAFDAAPNKSGFGASNPDWVNWGHYTQMMWSATTKIGCGSAPGPKYVITSCRYSPPGNFDGQLPYPGADTMTVPPVATSTTAAAPTTPPPDDTTTTTAPPDGTTTTTPPPDDTTSPPG